MGSLYQTDETKICKFCGNGYGNKTAVSKRLWDASTTCSRRCSMALGRKNRVWPSLDVRFAAKVLRTGGQGPRGDCHEWQGHRMKWGYGSFRVGNKVKKAHRVAYQLFCGEIPAGKMVLHSCDNPPCCNPDHLALGNQVKNMEEKRARGRNRNRGEEKLPRVDDIPDGMPIPGDLNHLQVYHAG